MPLVALEQLLCPLDNAILSRHAQQWQCPQGHCFDIAKQGHVNLLPVQNKKSREPGDSKAMITARRDFLNSGAYAAISEFLNTEIAKSLPATESLSILDAGCGDGYYLNQLCQNLLDRQQNMTVCGLDISKWAVQACCKRSPGINGIVASNKKVPLPSSSQDLIICAFGFPVFDEFQRLLKAGGQLIMLDVGPRHLLEMREILYPQVRQHNSYTAPPCSDTAGKWQLRQQATLETASPALSQQQLAWLLCMTPHGYRSSEARQQQLLASAPLAVNIDVVLRAYHYVS